MNPKITPSTFLPAPLLQNPHLQTLYATFFRQEKIEGTRTEIFRLPDGDFIECVWYGEADGSKPIVVLLHGLEGSVESSYIVGMMKALDRAGFVPVLMHFRGCGSQPNDLPRAYHSGDTADARGWIEHLHTLYPDAPLYAVGFSIGGNVLLKLLGEWGSNAPLVAAAAVSVPMQLDISADTLENGFAKIYQRHLLTPLKENLLQKYERFDMERYLGIDAARVKAIKTIREFDELYTAKIHGFASAEAYYKASSSRQYLRTIGVSTLILHAEDDPFMTPAVIPSSEELSDTVRLELSAHGGHVGFVSGSIFKPLYWFEERIGSFFQEIKNGEV